MRFLRLWLPSLLLFLAGLHRAWLTGQADPFDWSVPTALVLVVTGLLAARRGWAMLVWTALGSAGTVLLFCARASARPPELHDAAALLAIGLLSVLGGAFLRRAPGTAGRAGHLKAMPSGVLMLGIAALLLWRGPAQPLRPVAERPALAVITALPLFWEEMGRGGPRDAPIVTILRTRFTLVPLDDPQQLVQTNARRLLLAQPRAMTAAQMVALDAWVRDGGIALVLADPLLSWPGGLPLGDRRRAPPVSLLGTALSHWGFDRGGHFQSSEIRHFMPDGALVTIAGAELRGRALMVERRVGRGTVRLVGDADLLDDRLWLAEPARPLDPRLWSADTPAQLVRWLGGDMPSERRWMHTPADVVAALRWVVGVGIFWAMLGTVLPGRVEPGMRLGTKRENKPLKSGEND
jgi:hypothetical protein